MHICSARITEINDAARNHAYLACRGHNLKGYWNSLLSVKTRPRYGAMTQVRYLVLTYMMVLMNITDLDRNQ